MPTGARDTPRRQTPIFSTSWRPCIFRGATLSALKSTQLASANPAWTSSRAWSCVQGKVCSQGSSCRPANVPLGLPLIDSMGGRRRSNSASELVALVGASGELEPYMPTWQSESMPAALSNHIVNRLIMGSHNPTVPNHRRGLPCRTHKQNTNDNKSDTGGCILAALCCRTTW